jgi:cytochrome c5
MVLNTRARVLLRIALVLYLAAVVSVAVRAQSSAAARTVWDGVFTIEQADRGRILFAASCAECHGGSLEGGESTALSGDKFWAGWTQQTVGDLLTYVSKNMPRSEDGTLAGTLSAGTYTEIVTHILRTNGFPGGMQDLTAASASGVQIVRKDGSGELPASTLVHVVGCLTPRGADGSWRVVNASRPQRVSSSGAPLDRNAAPADRVYALKFVLTPLTKFVGHRVSVTGLLMGEGGVDGLNVNTVQSIAETCR